MGEFISMILCRNCGSRWVEIAEWSRDGKAILHCRTCDAKEEMGRFTLGRCQVTRAELENARTTKARKDKYEK